MSGAVASSAARWTDQQRAAIELRTASVGLSAGAGCGKTFVLTQRFLSHLEPDAPHPGPARVSQLVAITFTERAAREMRDRIRKACHDRLEHCPDADVDHWSAIVRDLDQARISTIHSFCSGLLRTHAVEAALDPNFQLLSETLSAGFMDTALAEAIRNLFASGDADVEELVYRLGGLGRVGDVIRPLLGRLYRIDLKAWRDRTPDEVIELWRRAWLDSELPRTLAEFATSPEGRELHALLEEVARKSPADKAALARGLVTTLAGWAAGEVSPSALKELPNHFKLDALIPRNFAPLEAVRERIKPLLEDMRKRLRSLADISAVTPADLYDAIALGRQLLDVCDRVAAAVERRKQAESLLDFDDLIVRARNLLRDFPTIRNRLAAGIRLLMVDEFQDTDPVQAELVRSLCGNDEALRGGKLFLVGDAKQSIYRFRNAEPNVFAELRRELPPSGRLPLSRNFRSQPAILQFVNALFDGAMTGEYEPLDAAADQVSTHPCIEFLLTTPSDNSPSATESEVQDASLTESEDGADDDSGNPSDESDLLRLRKREAAAIAGRISQLVHGQIPVVRHPDATGGITLRPARPRDIVILLRALTDVRLLEAALRNVGIDYYVVGGQAFYAQQEVYDVVNLFRAVDEPSDDVALLGVLRSPFFSLADDTIYLLASARKGLWQGLSNIPTGLSSDQTELAQRARSLLHELRREKDRLSRADWLRFAFDRTGYDASVLAEFLGPRKLANIEKLIELAEEIDAAGSLSLAAFTSRLQAAVFSEAKEALAPTHPESADVVRIMSIHQSKGLEFPVVFVADLDRRELVSKETATLDPEFGPLIRLPSSKRKTSQPSTGKSSAAKSHLGWSLYRGREQREADAERLRLFYVACTRAADLLILSAGTKSIDKPASRAMSLLARRFDLRTGLPVTPNPPGVPAIPDRSRAHVPRILVHAAPPQPVTPRDSGPVDPTGEAGIDRTPTGPAHFIDNVRNTAPADWPELSVPIPVDLGDLNRRSVSELELIPLEQLGLTGWWTRHPDFPFEIIEHRRPAQRPEPITSPSRNETDAERLGTLVHAVLERLPAGESADLDRAIRDAWGNRASPLTDDLRSAAHDMLDNLLNSPLWSRLAAAVCVEREIPFIVTLPEHDITWQVTGSIDLLIAERGSASTDERTWSIFDYKTSSLGPRSAASRRTRALELLSTYELQLGAYAVAITTWSGRPPESVSLVLVANGITELRVCPTAEFLEATQQRLRAAARFLQRSAQ